jgi:molecular chaperone DnaJ
MGFMGTDTHGQANYPGSQQMNQEDLSAFMKGFGGINDIFSEFENLFGGGGMGGGKARASGASMPRQGRNIQMSMDLTFEEAARGVKKTVTFMAHVICKACKGSGAKAGTKPIACETCSGSGTESIRSGFFSFSRPCRSCGGSGNIILAKCTVCHATGKVQEKRSLKVEIPAGVDNGMSIRFSDQGEPGEFGGPPGHLYVIVNMIPSKVFRREGANIHVDLRISFIDAILGAKIKVPTLEGDIEVSIPPGTQPGDHIILHHKGIKLPGTSFHGHQYVNFNVYLPKQLTPHQKELLEELKESEYKTASNSKNEDRSSSFFSQFRSRFQNNPKKSNDVDEMDEKTG